MMDSHGHPRRRPSRRGPSNYGLQSERGEQNNHELDIPKGRYCTSKMPRQMPCLVCLVIVMLHSILRFREPVEYSSAIPKQFFEFQPRVIFLDTPYKVRQAFSSSKWIQIREVSGTDLSFRHDERRKIASAALDMEQGGCKFISSWQSESARPNCNSIHEVGMRIGYELKHLDSGGFKDVWQPLDGNGHPENFILKTTIYRKGFSESYLDKHRRDALVMEQGTKSPHVLNLHAYCAFSNVVERASGTLQNWIQNYRQESNSTSVLKLALAVAEGVEQSQLYHNGMPTVAHADVKSSQFLFTAGSAGPVLKINDFNRCRFLTSKRYPSICNFTIPNKHKGSTMRSPEEYTDDAGQNDKIDVYSTGSILYQMVTGSVPFQGESFAEAMEMIKSGKAPLLRKESITDQSITTMVQVMEKCWTYRASDRPASSTVSKLLRDALERVQKAD